MLAFSRIARSARYAWRVHQTANPRVFKTTRVPLHHPGFPLVLLFTQKSGCTAFARWFFFQIGKLEEAEQYHRWIHNYRNHVHCRQPGYRDEAVRLLVARERPVMKLVRNPYDRAVSSFLQTLETGHEAHKREWGRRFIRSARKRAGKPALDEPTLSFRDFIRHVERTGADYGRLNDHIAQQYVPAEKGRIDRLLRVERLNEELRSLQQEFNLGEAPTSVLSSHHHHRESAGSQSGSSCAVDRDFTRAEVKRREVPAYAAFYDEEARASVRGAFAADFEAYGYDR